MEAADYSEVTRARPEKSLTRGKNSTGGRNSGGRTTSRFRGNGNKRRFRRIDFTRDKVDVPATVAHIEYDPNRSARIALLHYADGEKRYILCPERLKVGDKVVSGHDVELTPGNCLPLGEIPNGVPVHNVELTPGRGGAMVRAAGQQALVRSREGDYCQVRLPSGEVRQVHVKCRATIGQVGNVDHMNVKLGKAGKSRYRGRRPHVRGVVQNPVDHPMGGGEGRSSGGGHPRSPWSKLSKAGKTRKPKKRSNKFIVQRRKK
jgi:large subunit ribosomal protein L2